MRKALLTILSVTSLAQNLFASGTWTNEPAGSHTFLDCPFNTLGECHITGPGGAIVLDGTAPISPSNVAKSTIAAGANSGGSELHYYTPQQNKELFVGLMWKTNPQFEGRTVVNKLFFVRGPGVNGFFGIWAPPGSKTMQFYFGPNTSGLDNSHTCAGEGLICYSNAGASMVTIGQWTKIEVYMKASTTMTSRDGVVRWWVDGQLGGNYTNFNYSTSINEWVWSETWDGYVNPVPNVEWSHYVDHVYVSAPNFVLSLPSIATDTIPSTAQSGKSYAAYLKAAAQYPPLSWTISGGSLPGGLVLGEKTGVISGVPNTCGLHNFTARLSDANKSVATKSFSINVTGTCTSGMDRSRELTVVSREPENGIRIESRAGGVQFSLPLSQPDQYQLSIYDLSGKKVYACSGAGKNEVKIKTALGNGVYLAKFKQGSRLNAVRFNVLN